MQVFYLLKGNPPRAAYKHVPRRYAKAFENGEQISIATYSYYRQMEGDRGDKLEGSVNSQLSQFQAQGAPTPDELRRLRAVGVNADSGCTGLFIGDAVRKAVLADSYLFSASTEPDGRLAHEGQVIFEISDMARFAAALTMSAREVLRFPTYGTVQYRPREINVLINEPEEPDPFVKDPVFSAEKDVRIVWPPANSGKSQMIIRAPAAAEFIRRWHS